FLRLPECWRTGFPVTGADWALIASISRSSKKLEALQRAPAALLQQAARLTRLSGYACRREPPRPAEYLYSWTMTVSLHYHDPSARAAAPAWAGFLAAQGDAGLKRLFTEAGLTRVAQSVCDEILQRHWPDIEQAIRAAEARGLDPDQAAELRRRGAL